MRLYRLWVVLTPLIFCMTVFAQKVKTVEGSYQYQAPDNCTVEQAKRTAIERARIEALVNEFGTTVTQTNLSSIGTSKVDFHSVGMSEVRGEWLEDLEPPQVDIKYINGLLTIIAKVKGKARELRDALPDCKVRVLRNGKEDKFESERFFNNDQIYVSFQSPANGTLAIYLSDNKGQVACLLPYPSQTIPGFPIKANKKYILFDSEEGDEFTEEYYLYCGKTSEINQIYVIFSPNHFTKAVDYDKERANPDIDYPRELPEEEFQKWLAKCRHRDNQLQVIRKYITIENQ